MINLQKLDDIINFTEEQKALLEIYRAFAYVESYVDKFSNETQQKAVKKGNKELSFSNIMNNLNSKFDNNGQKSNLDLCIDACKIFSTIDPNSQKPMQEDIDKLERFKFFAFLMKRRIKNPVKRAILDHFVNSNPL